MKKRKHCVHPASRLWKWCTVFTENAAMCPTRPYYTEPLKHVALRLSKTIIRFDSFRYYTREFISVFLTILAFYGDKFSNVIPKTVKSCDCFREHQCSVVPGKKVHSFGGRGIQVS